MEKLHTSVRPASALCTAAFLIASLAALAIAPAVASAAVTPMVAANSYATFGLRDDGKVLGTGTMNPGETIATVWTNISTISVGAYHVAGLRADGSVVMAGNWARPEVIGADGWTGISQIACGAFHTVGLKADGTVVAAGDPAFNEVSGVAGWTDIKYVACGGFHTIGVKADGSVVATGWFMPGFGDTYGICAVSGWSGIRAVAAGQFFTIGLKEDGTCVATGQNDWDDAPGLITNVNDSAVWNDIKKVTANYETAAGLKNDGTVVTSYDNSTVPGWTDIVDIASGDFSIIGLRPDGTVVTYTMPGNRDDLWHALGVSGWDLTPSKATLSKPTGPTSVYKSHYFTIKGTIKPIHAKGAKVVTVYCERRVKVSGHYVWTGRKAFLATDLTATSTYTPWSVKFTLTTKGYWRVWSYHADAAHLASKSVYKYLTVK
jgi:hypothetical protein